jgi:hypothetical protein
MVVIAFLQLFETVTGVIYTVMEHGIVLHIYLKNVNMLTVWVWLMKPCRMIYGERGARIQKSDRAS